MNQLKFFALVGIFLSLLRPLPTQAFQLSDAHPNYVVIGAFKYHRNAVRLTSHVSKDLMMNAKYEMNPNRNLYYVYVLNTSDREEAIAEALRLREQSEFKDTWVYNGYLGKIQTGRPVASGGVDIHPRSEKLIEPGTSDGNEEVKSALVANASSDSQGVTSSPRVSKPVSMAPTGSDSELDGKSFHFKLSRILDDQAIDGDVDVVDQDKLRKIGTYKGNMNVRVVSPPGKSGNISLICEVFGYRKMQRDVDYNNPAGEGVEMTSEGAVLVPFELVRLQKGDIATMYHVYFFKDAAIMRPESRYEVTSLLEMLQENEKYKIRIHGHANGKAAGKIAYADAKSENFFSLSNTREGYGSSKKLSEDRAELIRNFLIANGVAPQRMQVKAWGGKRPIHDKMSSRAQENVRVEIEILDN